MKEFDFFKHLTAILAAFFVVLFVAGCGTNEENTWDNGSYVNGEYTSGNKRQTADGLTRVCLLR